MAWVKGDLEINRPVEEVFDFVADERNEPRYNPRMLRVEKLTPGPIGAGTRFRAELATVRGSAPMTIEFTAYERPRRLASATRLSNMDIEGSLSFDPVSEGTRIRWSWKINPRGFLRLLGPLVARLGRRQERMIWTGLKQLLEEESAAGVPARRSG